jgi:uncharacterized protein with GYD domain
MPKFLIAASYTSEGAAGVAEKGGTARRDAVAQMISAAGGQLETFHFGFGDTDAYVIVDLPSNEVAAGIALSINRSGATTVKTTVLLTPEEMDEAAKSAPTYRAPGG